MVEGESNNLLDGTGAVDTITDTVMEHADKHANNTITTSNKEDIYQKVCHLRTNWL